MKQNKGNVKKESIKKGIPRWHNDELQGLSLFVIVVMA